jgi:hypothetical protein
MELWRKEREGEQEVKREWLPLRWLGKRFGSKKVFLNYRKTNREKCERRNICLTQTHKQRVRERPKRRYVSRRYKDV